MDTDTASAVVSVIVAIASSGAVAALTQALLQRRRNSAEAREMWERLIADATEQLTSNPPDRRKLMPQYTPLQIAEQHRDRAEELKRRYNETRMITNPDTRERKQAAIMREVDVLERELAAGVAPGWSDLNDGVHPNWNPRIERGSVTYQRGPSAARLFFGGVFSWLSTHVRSVYLYAGGVCVLLGVLGAEPRAFGGVVISLGPLLALGWLVRRRMRRRRAARARDAALLHRIDRAHQWYLLTGEYVVNAPADAEDRVNAWLRAEQQYLLEQQMPGAQVAVEPAASIVPCTLNRDMFRTSFTNDLAETGDSPAASFGQRVEAEVETQLRALPIAGPLLHAFLGQRSQSLAERLMNIERKL